MGAWSLNNIKMSINSILQFLLYKTIATEYISFKVDEDSFIYQKYHFSYEQGFDDDTVTCSSKVSSRFPTNTSHGFQLKTTWKRSFPRRVNMVCLNGSKNLQKAPSPNKCTIPVLMSHSFLRSLSQCDTCFAKCVTRNPWRSVTFNKVAGFNL